MINYRYCLIKDTKQCIVSGVFTDDVLFQNAINAGFTAEQVEILTQEQYDERKTLEPVPEPVLSDKERIAQLEQENLLLKAQNIALTERTDFHEEVLTEIILSISP